LHRDEEGQDFPWLLEVPKEGHRPGLRNLVGVAVVDNGKREE